MHDDLKMQDHRSAEDSMSRELREKREAVERSEALAARREADAHAQEIERRVRYTRPPIQGDAAGEAAAARAIELAREAQTTPYAVAPGATVVSLSRGVRQAGDPIDIGDVGDDVEVLDMLVRRGVVLRVDVRGREPLGAHHTHVVTPGRFSITSRRGVLVSGMGVSAADFATPHEPEIPAIQSQLMPDGTIVPGHPGRAAVPATDGTAVIADLVARGLIVPREHDSTPRATAGSGGGARRRARSFDGGGPEAA